MTDLRCGICGGDVVLRHRGSSAALTSEALSPTCHTPGAHGDLWRCRACGTLQQPGAPRGRELVDLYRGMRDDAYLEQEAGRRATARRLLALVDAHAGRPGRLLEVGCGPGLALDEARSRGWEVRGLEPAAASRAHARELGLAVDDATLEDLAPEERFDAILMVDVVEHLDDPPGALRRCADHLTDGGLLLVVTPDPSSPTARLAGSRWWGLLPAHTYLLPRATLHRLLADAGFAVVDDRGLRRSFTLDYWIGGLSERAAAVARLAGRVRSQRLVTLSLGDERVVLARRGVATPSRNAAARERAPSLPRPPGPSAARSSPARRAAAG